MRIADLTESPVKCTRSDLPQTQQGRAQRFTLAACRSGPAWPDQAMVHIAESSIQRRPGDLFLHGFVFVDSVRS